jgi:hypothetical protein
VYPTPRESHFQYGTPREPRPQPRSPRAVLLVIGILAVGAALAGCGGGTSTPGVATLSTSTSTARSSTGADTQAAGLLAYASCMRSHGVANFPDPNGSGAIEDKRAVVRALQGVSDSQAQTAQRECQHLIPAGEGLGGKASQLVAAQQQHYYLSAAACMRSHGITNFPDPTFSAGRVKFPIPPSIDMQSTRAIEAREICQKLIPAGLPYSGTKE